MVVRDRRENGAPVRSGNEVVAPLSLVAGREEEEEVGFIPTADVTACTGRNSNLINLFDQNAAEQKTLTNSPVFYDGMADHAESQSPRIEPWDEMNENDKRTVGQDDQARIPGLQAGSTLALDGPISLQLDQQTLFHILQSFSQSDHNDLNQSRKIPTNTASFHISRTSPYKTRPFPFSLQAKRSANRDTSQPYPITFKSQPLALSFPTPRAGDPTASSDTLMTEPTPATKPPHHATMADLLKKKDFSTSHDILMAEPTQATQPRQLVSSETQPR